MVAFLLRFFRSSKSGRTALVALVAITAMVLYAGCGSEGEGGSGAVETSAAAVADEGGTLIAACNIVTEADATALFGKQAVKDEGVPVTDPNMIGECLWTWDTETSNQLLQFRIWDGEQYFGQEPSGSQSLDLGDKAYVNVGSISGVDITWVQDGKTIRLSYSSIGDNVPDPATRVEEMKQLAGKVSGQL